MFRMTNSISTHNFATNLRVFAVRDHIADDLIGAVLYVGDVVGGIGDAGYRLFAFDLIGEEQALGDG